MMAFVSTKYQQQKWRTRIYLGPYVFRLIDEFAREEQK